MHSHQIAVESIGHEDHLNDKMQGVSNNIFLSWRTNAECTLHLGL
jgi:hypothetical protein